MAELRQDETEKEALSAAVGKSRKLAARVPRLILEARRVASTVIHGLHGRRRAGAGENFWQYRRFTNGEPSHNVDWRRSARDDHLYVREREWEASHSIWLWVDRSPSMDFNSHLTEWSKLDRALVVSFALAEVLVQGGERVGIPELMRPTSNRNVIEKMAQVMLHDSSERLSLPPNFAPAPFSEVLLVSDLWGPVAEFRRIIGQLAANGARGHVVQVVDPAEESFPYSGRVEFVESEGLGSITAGRAELWRSRLSGAGRQSPRRVARRGRTFRLDIHHSSHRPRTYRTAVRHSWPDGRRSAHQRQEPPARALRPGSARMIAGLPLSFAEPFLLLGLLSLPVLWWLLRVMPPRPRRIEFPPTRLLFDIAPKEETPSRTPWWLTLLRLTAAALVILAAAGPIWNPQTGAAGGNSAPLVILLDDGWSAAASWDTRIKAADELIANADNDRRGVALIPLSEPARDITLMTGGTARVALRQFAPKPYAVERVETLPAIERFLKATGDSEIAWLSDGVDTGRGPEFLEGLSKAIGDRTLTIFEGAPPAHALAAAENAAAKMTVKVLRANGSIAIDTGIVRGLDQKGSPIGEARYTFAPQDRETEAAFDLPVELRNDIARLEIAGERSAGAVQLLDKRWRRRAIGIVSGSTNDTAQPLLASTFYLTRALAPFADVRLGDKGAAQQAITQFLDQKLPMIVLADVGTLSPEIRETTQRLDRARRRAGAFRRSRASRRRMTIWCR